MPNQFRLIYQGSPFLPQFDSQAMVAEILQILSPTFEPAAAIALAITPIMGVHTVFLRLDAEVLNTYSITEKNLQNLIMGFQYPLETIQASAVCKKVATKEERLSLYEQLVSTTHHFDTLRIQDQIALDLNATCNLLQKDPSTALVFQFLKDYPFSEDIFFLTGMEIAAMIFFGLALELVKSTGDNSWLCVSYDPSDLG